MTKNLAIFDKFKIRRHFDEENQKWLFSVIDIVCALTNQPDYAKSRNYWKVLKHRLNKEGSQVVTNCNQLKMQSSDGKFYNTDVADTQTIFRLVQSIPSKNAEPIKLTDYWSKSGVKEGKEYAILTKVVPLKTLSSKG